MHDGMQYDQIQGQGHEPLKVGNCSIFKSYLLRNFQRELASDHCYLNCFTISKFDQAGLWFFILVFVSHYFELSRTVSCEELTVSPVRG